MSPFFSVIIPTLNEEMYLPHVLADLGSQTHKDFEVIIADGKSTDHTQQEAEKFTNTLPITFLRCAKRNVSYQRNTGAKKAQGTYLVFLDADNRVPKDFIANLVVPCQKRRYRLIIPTILPEDSSQKTKVLISLVNTLIKLSQTYGRPLSGGGNFIIEKSLFDSLHGFTEDLFMSEDHDLVRRAWKKGIKAKILPNVRVINSMRRGDIEGDMSLIYKYVVGFLAYTVVPTDRAIKAKLFDYEMGGHRYDTNSEFSPRGKAGKIQSSKLKNKGKKLSLRQMKQFAKFNSVLMALKNLSGI